MLINDQSDLNYARRNSKKLDFVITAHLQLEYLAKNFNLNVRSGNELVDPTEYDYYSKRVMKNLIWVESALKNTCPDDFVSISLALLARKLHVLNLIEKISKNESVIFIERPQRKFDRLVQNTVSVNNVYFCNLMPKSDYYLDFQSESGAKTGIFNLENNTFRISKCSFFKASIKKLSHNKEDQNIYCTIPNVENTNLPDSFYQISHQFSQFMFTKIEQFLLNYIQEFISTKIAFEKYFSHSKLPKSVYFSMVKNPYMAAAIHYFKEQNVPISMQSHGGMLSFGTESQIYISQKLSEGIYNFPPSADNIFLRSFTQKPNKHTDKIIKYKPVKFFDGRVEKNLSTNKFTILIALNFTNWGETCWGISSSCYDTFEVLKHISELARKTPLIKWQMRLKFSIKDTPTKADFSKIQGLEPSLVNKIFKDIPNVENVSTASYEDLMSNCNIVITEGITSVTFDAWDMRKPVIFLKHHELIRGSHPVIEFTSLSKTMRAPYYVETIETLTVTRIKHLANLHRELNLSKDELNKVINIC